MVIYDFEDFEDFANYTRISPLIFYRCSSRVRGLAWYQLTAHLGEVCFRCDVRCACQDASTSTVTPTPHYIQEHTFLNEVLAEAFGTRLVSGSVIPYTPPSEE
jgi:hypothetical protein